MSLKVKNFLTCNIQRVSLNRGVVEEARRRQEIPLEIESRKSASIAGVYLKQILPCELMDRVRQIYYFIKIEDKAANRRKMQIGN
ncbi:MAG: hypothetical protein EA390_01815 [Balneolaceae bacterium]|nr:MAG: hypothetical protein EA390_01815 [Balneolaceae bacterium]